MADVKLPTASKRTPVTFVVFNGPVELTCYRGLVNRVDKSHGTVVVNSSFKTPVLDNMYIENSLLYVGEDKFPLQGGRVLQFR